MSLFEKDFETVIFDSLRVSPLYVGFDDRDGSYTKVTYSKEFHCDLRLLADYLEKTQPLTWTKLQKQYAGFEAAAVAAGAPGAVPGSDDEAKARLGDYFAEVLLLDQGTVAAKARAELGWAPSHPALPEEFRDGSYRKVTTG